MLLMMGEVFELCHCRALFSHLASSGECRPYNQTLVRMGRIRDRSIYDPAIVYVSGRRRSSVFHRNSRSRKGQSFRKQLVHTIWRSFILVALGIFLRSIHSSQTYFTFEDTLTQIGLGYTFAFLLAYCRPKWQWISLAAILFGYWLAWALYPAPGPNFNYAAVGVPADWHHNFSGFASHWNKNSNLGQAVDLWFLNLVPRASRFLYNDGGYLTLSFIPTLGTMLLGLQAGEWFRSAAPRIPVKRLLVAGLLLIAVRRSSLLYAGNLPDRSACLDA